MSETLLRTGSHYSELMLRVRAAGLLNKVPSFYIKRLIIITIVSLALWATSYAVSHLDQGYWLAIPIAALLGIMAAQYGFIAHEASHRQVFRNNRLNDRVGLLLANGLAGLSYGFWLNKHNRHHAKPNQIGADPDIAIRALSFTPESRDEKKGFEHLVSRNQGWLFPFLLTLTAFDLLADSIVAITRRDKPLGPRLFEFSLMLVRQAAPIVIFWILFGPLIGLTLWFVMMLAFGLFMEGPSPRTTRACRWYRAMRRPTSLSGRY